jgi:hypothetical protein
MPTPAEPALATSWALANLNKKKNLATSWAILVWTTKIFIKKTINFFLKKK